MLYDQNMSLNILLNKNNMSSESLDNNPCFSSSHEERLLDSDEEDIAELDQVLLKLDSIEVEIESVANNQSKIISKVKKNSKKLSDLKLSTNKQLDEFTGSLVDGIDSSMYVRKAECGSENSESHKHVN